MFVTENVNNKINTRMEQFKSYKEKKKLILEDLNISESYREKKLTDLEVSHKETVEKLDAEIRAEISELRTKYTKMMNEQPLGSVQEEIRALRNEMLNDRVFQEIINQFKDKKPDVTERMQLLNDLKYKSEINDVTFEGTLRGLKQVLANTEVGHELNNIEIAHREGSLQGYQKEAMKALEGIQHAENYNQAVTLMSSFDTATPEQRISIKNQLHSMGYQAPV